MEYIIKQFETPSQSVVLPPISPSITQPTSAETQKLSEDYFSVNTKTNFTKRELEITYGSYGNYGNYGKYGRYDQYDVYPTPSPIPGPNGEVDNENTTVDKINILLDHVKSGKLEES